MVDKAATTSCATVNGLNQYPTVGGKNTTYDAKGNVMPNGSNLGPRFFMGGKQYFSEIWLYNLRNRFYSPDWGRFLQPDPIGFTGDPSNIYRYCGNNPANGSDPEGTNVSWIWSSAENHSYVGMSNASGMTYFNFYPKFKNVFSLTLGPGVWAQSNNRPAGTTYATTITSPEQDAQI